MLAVVNTLRQLGSRRALNAWRAMCAENGEQRARLAAALHSLAPEGRAKRAGLNSWKELAEERALMRKAAKSLLLLGARRAYNAWTEMCAEAQERRARMRGALNSLLQLGSRRALNAWRAMAAEVGAARRKAAGAARTFGPEGRMQRAAWNSWRELCQERELMRGVATSMMLQGQRKCLNGWKEMVEAAAAKKLAMLKVAAAIRMRGSRMAWNAWTELTAEMAAAKFKLAGAARSFSPEGRAQRAAWNAWKELWGELV